MENRRFRNHFSMVVERLGFIFFTLAFVIVPQLLEELSGLLTSGIQRTPVLIGVGVVFLFLLILFLWQVRVWYLTWITIEEETITIERNTLMKKKNTIGFQNISNVNTEQNIFEMLLGTCKVKLDTNSLSTANATDVKIVLKKKDAEQMKKLLMKRIRELSTGGMEETVEAEETRGYDVISSTKDIFFHGVFSINLLTVVILLSSVSGAAAAISKSIVAGDFAKGIATVMASLFTLGILIYSSLASLVKGFISLYGFKATRADDRIYLKYGLLKKVDYAIPVDKINGIHIHQTLLARIFHRYTAELINVGMGDDEKSSAYFVFYTTKEKLTENFHLLLPEFEDAIDWKMDRQPRCIWMLKVLSVVIMTAVFALGGLAVYEIAPELPCKGIYFLCVLLLDLLAGLIKFLGYFTVGTDINENFLEIARGSFGKQYVIMKYRKIQYAKFSQNFVTKKLGIGRGKVTLLASAKEKDQEIPYIKAEKIEEIRKGLLSRS